MDGGPYPASAITEIESRLIFVPRADFEALCRENPDVAQAVIRELGKRLRHLVQVTETLAFRDVAARLAHFLAGYAEQHGRVTAVAHRETTVTLRYMAAAEGLITTAEEPRPHAHR